MPRRGQVKEKPVFKCEHCPYTTTRQTVMVEHTRVHTGDRPFSCEICGKSFTQKSNLGQHLKVHGAGKAEVFSCDLCHFSSKWKTSLQIHARMHSGEKPYKCNICDKTFSQSTHCNTHVRESHANIRNFQCDECGKYFKRQDHLQRHQMFHKNERIIPCDVCNKMFLDKRTMASHKLTHMGEASKVYKCDLCPYKSRYKQGLDVHYRVHTGIKPYPCSSCSKSFVTSQARRVHTRMIHDGLKGKIFHCDHKGCGFITANKQALKSHVKRIHLGIKLDKPGKCPYCQKIYQGFSSLYSHKKKKHPRLVAEEMRQKRLKKTAMMKAYQIKMANGDVKKEPVEEGAPVSEGSHEIDMRATPPSGTNKNKYMNLENVLEISAKPSPIKSSPRSSSPIASSPGRKQKARKSFPKAKITVGEPDVLQKLHLLAGHISQKQEKRIDGGFGTQIVGRTSKLAKADIMPEVNGLKMLGGHNKRGRPCKNAKADVGPPEHHYSIIEHAGFEKSKQCQNTPEKKVKTMKNCFPVIKMKMVNKKKATKKKKVPTATLR